MFGIELYWAFVITSSILIMLPGPNVMMIIANTLSHGNKHGLITTCGANAGMSLQIILVMLGAAALLTVFSNLFEWVRWIGVAYLLYLGVLAWISPPADLSHTQSQGRSLRYVFWQGFLIAITNPKTLLFHASFLPQFITPDATIVPQFIVLGTTFIALGFIVDACWILVVGTLKNVLPSKDTIQNRISGTLFILAGLGLAAAREK